MRGDGLVIGMFWKNLARYLTAIPLFFAASYILFSGADAHVTMCMVSAIGYSIALLFSPKNRLSNKITSVFAGGILFYTIYVGSTMMYFEWFSEFLWEPASWIYHILINPAILVMFLAKKEDMDFLLAGFEGAAIISPVMILFNTFAGKELWYWETPQIIYLYAVFGVVMMVIHFIFAKKAEGFWSKFLSGLRIFVIVSMIFYTVTLTVMVFLSRGTVDYGKQDSCENYKRYDRYDPKYVPGREGMNREDFEGYEYEVPGGRNYQEELDAEF